MAFCTNCGKPINPGEKFCGSCGTSLTVTASSLPAALHPEVTPIPPPQATTPPAPAVAVEGVIGVFPVSRKKGMFAQESFHVVFTPRRLIFAAFTSELIKEAAKEEGKDGFLAGMVGAMTLGYNYYKHYLTMDPETALKQNPQNFALDISRIRKIKLELGKKQVDKNRHVDVYENSKLELETVGDKYTFAVANHFHNLAADTIRKSGLM
jgi:hypothetical protein